MMCQIPQWKALPRNERRFVWEHCVHPLVTSTSAQNLKVLLFGLALFAAYSFGLLGQVSTSLATFVVLVLAPGEVVELILAARNRQIISNFIQNRATEATAAAAAKEVSSPEYS